MQRKKLFLLLVTLGALIVIVSGIALAVTQPVHAQCGSQVSSCKNCHEVQAQKPVNNDGTAWHTSHAFGDFCYICHAGNQTATDKTAAHVGMVSPLADIKASCQSCHPNDLQARAQVYAAKLGVTLGAASTQAASPATPTAAASTTSATPQGAAAAPQAALSPNDPNLVNYVERYNENVLGQYPINWGNVILLVLIGVMGIGGAVLVLSREGWIRISFKETKPVTDEYPADVVELVPQIAKLKPNARKSLAHLLQRPDATAEVLTSLDKLAESKPATPPEK